MIEYHKNFSLENLFYINEKGLVCQEEFRDVIGYEGKYQVSDLGRVKSLRRKVFGGKVWYSTKDIILKQQNNRGYLQVCLHKDSVGCSQKTHLLVARCFLNHVFSNYKRIVDHANNISKDSRLSNLQIITQLENSLKDKPKKHGGNYIYKEDGRYRLRINIDGKRKCFGYFDTSDLAKNFSDFIFNKIKNNEPIDEYVKVNKNKYYKNIKPEKGKYRPEFYYNKKRIRLPMFKTPKEAYDYLVKYKKENNIPL
jgi:hypothetical protein